MTQNHCGVRLVRVTPDGPASGKHIWQCAVCKQQFEQKIRQPKKKEKV